MNLCEMVMVATLSEWWVKFCFEYPGAVCIIAVIAVPLVICDGLRKKRD